MRTVQARQVGHPPVGLVEIVEQAHGWLGGKPRGGKATRHNVVQHPRQQEERKCREQEEKEE